MYATTYGFEVQSNELRNKSSSNITWGTQVGATFTENMRLSNTGNLGIGTATPSAALDVAGTGLFNESLKIRDADNSGYAEFAITDNASQNLFKIQTSFGTVNDIVFVVNDGTSGEEVALTLEKSTGNVGVGTLEPTTQLDVAGDARIRTLAAGAATDEIVTTDANGNLRKRTLASMATSLGVADTQDLSQAGNTISLVDGGSVDVSTTTAVSANTDKIGITTAQANAITANTAKVTDDDEGVAEVYSAAGWDADTASPTKNDVRDKFVSIDAAITASGDDLGDHTATTTLNMNSNNINNVNRLDILNVTAGNTHLPHTNNWNYISGEGTIFRDENNVEKMRLIGATGNLGIGTTAPAALLDVAGDARIRTLAAGAATDEIVTTDANGNLRKRTLASIASNTNDVNLVGDSFIGANSGPGANGTSEGTAVNRHNIFLGPAAGLSNTSGSNNIFLGYESGRTNTTGRQNIFQGAFSGRQNTTGEYNTFIGYNGGRLNATSSYNVGLGGHALYDLTGGDGHNTAIGRNTGRGITTGAKNTIIGANVTGLSATLANNIIIADGDGNRRINVDAAGNVGIGITVPTAKLHVVGAIASSTGGLSVMHNNGTAGIGVGYNAISAIGSNTNNHLNLLPTGTGGVGIGTETPTAKLDVVGNVNISNTLQFANTIGEKLNLYSNTYGIEVQGGELRNKSSANTTWGTHDGTTFTERMRLGSTGTLRVGAATTGSVSLIPGSATASGYLGVYNSSVSRLGYIGYNNDRMYYRADVNNHYFSTAATGATASTVIIQGSDNIRNGALRINANNSYWGPALIINHSYAGSNGNDVEFRVADVVRGTIKATTGGVTFNTTSDRRLKTDISPTKFALDDLMNVKVQEYYWKSDSIRNKKSIGFIAQDLHKIYPTAVSEGGEDELTKPWTVDYGKLTPLLVKSVQDLNKKTENSLDKIMEIVSKQQQVIEQLQKDLKDVKTQLKKQLDKK